MDEDEKRDADLKKINTDNTISKKIDRAVTKGIITEDEGKILYKALTKEAKKHKADWWYEEKIYKSYEVATHLLEEGEYMTLETEKEILQRIEKA